jgi:hypothetical protein
VRRAAEKSVGKGTGGGTVKPPPVKKRRVIKPADMVKTPYLETMDDVAGFLDALRRELEKAIAANERIQIR